MYEPTKGIQVLEDLRPVSPVKDTMV